MSKIKKRGNPFQNRIRRARSTLPFVKVNSTDASNRPKDLYVPGSRSKLYNVLLKRTPDMIVAECFVVNHNIPTGSVRCLGSLNSVCYHIVGALMFSAEEKGYDVSICQRESTARNLSNIGGAIYKVVSKNANLTLAVVDNPLWIVCNKKEDNNGSI